MKTAAPPLPNPVRAPDLPVSPTWAAAIVAVILIALAMARPIDHDESQYVAAAVLGWQGLPYRDFAYLQTPLQPLLFAPLAALAGPFAYPVLRLINALLGWAAILAVHAAARAAGASEAKGIISAGLFGACDVFLFSVSVARNDALPVALLALAIMLIVRTPPQAAMGTGTAILTGLLLAAAGAAKISYAIPAVAFGLYAVADRRYRPAALVMGATPMLLLVGWTWAMAPGAFWFEVITFPINAPNDWYAGGPRAGKLTLVAKLVDTVKFLALGPALLAMWAVVRRNPMGRETRAIDIMIIAGLVAALVPTPSWRQYLLPLLPALFVRLAIAWECHPPGRGQRIMAITLACAGVSPSVESILRACSAGVPMMIAARESAAIAGALDHANVHGPIATLSPQFVPATGRPIDPRFATGPFFFRSRTLLPVAIGRRWHMVARHSGVAINPPPAALLIGGEAAWTSGSAAIDVDLLRHPTFARWRRVRLSSTRFQLYLPPPVDPETWQSGKVIR